MQFDAGAGPLLEMFFDSSTEIPGTADIDGKFIPIGKFIHTGSTFHLPQSVEAERNPSPLNNGFRHLKLELGALQDEIHLGEKFDKTPGGSTPIWLVSVRTGGPYGQKLVGTLRYLLPVDLADIDSDEAVSPALPQLHRDLKGIINGQSPDALKKVVSV